LAFLICWIIYWCKIASYKNQIINSNIIEFDAEISERVWYGRLALKPVFQLQYRQHFIASFPFATGVPAFIVAAGSFISQYCVSGMSNKIPTFLIVRIFSKLKNLAHILNYFNFLVLTIRVRFVCGGWSIATIVPHKRFLNSVHSKRVRIAALKIMMTIL
jgi:hypothetical protein